MTYIPPMKSAGVIPMDNISAHDLNSYLNAMRYNPSEHDDTLIGRLEPAYPMPRPIPPPELIAPEEVEQTKDPLIIHKSFSYSRTKTSWAEKLCADFWEAENVRHGRNGYRGCLDMLLGHVGLQENQFSAQCVAQVIQWFGTNVGSTFFKELAATMQVGDELHLQYDKPPLTEISVAQLGVKGLKLLRVQALKCWCDVNKSGKSIEKLLTSKDVNEQALGKFAAELESTAHWPVDGEAADVPEPTSTQATMPERTKGPRPIRRLDEDEEALKRAMASRLRTAKYKAPKPSSLYDDDMDCSPINMPKKMMESDDEPPF